MSTITNAQSFSNTITFGAISITNLTLTGTITNNKTATAGTISGTGTCSYNQVENGSAFKVVCIQLNALNGTATLTFPTAFTNTPAIYDGTGTGAAASSVVTTLSNTGAIITGSTTTGYIELRGI